MARGFPWRVHRCWCGEKAINTFNAEDYCAFHVPYEEMCKPIADRLCELVGKEKYGALINEWFPKEEDFVWLVFMQKMEKLLSQLELPTGLLSIGA